jgi:hypothetical protein
MLHLQHHITCTCTCSTTSCACCTVLTTQVNLACHAAQTQPSRTGLHILIASTRSVQHTCAAYSI